MARPADFLPQDGELATLIRSKDWSQTPLGTPATWPPSLRTILRLMLASRYSMWLGWGPELLFFYNDAYAKQTLGPKHPWALGRPAREVWTEVWGTLETRIDHVLRTREATWDEGLRLFLVRSGYPEETYHTFSYSPAPGDDPGETAGLFCVVVEETERVIGDRRIFGDGHPAAPEQLVVGDDGPWPFHSIRSNAAPVVVDLVTDRGWPTGAWDKAPVQALVIPIARQGEARPAGVLCSRLSSLHTHPLSQKRRCATWDWVLGGLGPPRLAGATAPPAAFGVLASLAIQKRRCATWDWVLGGPWPPAARWRDRSPRRLRRARFARGAVNRLDEAVSFITVWRAT